MTEDAENIHVFSTGKEEPIDTQNLGIKTQSLEDLSALGRLMRRSQIRLHSDLNLEGEQILAKVLFSSKNKRTKSEVEEI